MNASKICPNCSHRYGLNEASGFFFNRESDRVFCSQCQKKFFLIYADEGQRHKIVKLFANLLIPFGAVAGFWVIEQTLREAPYQTISIAHFVCAFLGATLGLALADSLKRAMIWKSGHISESSSD